MRLKPTLVMQVAIIMKFLKTQMQLPSKSMVCFAPKPSLLQEHVLSWCAC